MCYGAIGWNYPGALPAQPCLVWQDNRELPGDRIGLCKRVGFRQSVSLPERIAFPKPIRFDFPERLEISEFIGKSFTLQVCIYQPECQPVGNAKPVPLSQRFGEPVNKPEYILERLEISERLSFAICRSGRGGEDGQRLHVYQ